MAIGEYVADLLREAGVQLTPRTELPEPPTMPNLGEAFLRPYQDATRIAADASYGQVVCFCERVTAGEIRDAFDSLIPPRDLSGLRRRTRVLNGRCQGFFCGAEVATILAERRPEPNVTLPSEGAR
jgi:glycerol-3-phosphate dehydrogenase